jgi:hypothetical protein
VSENEDLRNLSEKYSHEEPVVFALIGNGQFIDWSSENQPKFCVWLPESIFDEIQKVALQNNCKILGSIDKFAQTTIGQNKLVDLLLDLGTIQPLSDNPDMKVIVPKLQMLVHKVYEKSGQELLIEGP